MKFSAPDPYATYVSVPNRAVYQFRGPNPKHPDYPPFAIRPRAVPGTPRFEKQAALDSTQAAIEADAWWEPYFQVVTEADRKMFVPIVPPLPPVPLHWTMVYWLAFCAFLTTVWTYLRGAPWATIRYTVLSIRFTLFSIRYALATALWLFDAACTWVVEGEADIPPIVECDACTELSGLTAHADSTLSHSSHSHSHSHATSRSGASTHTSSSHSSLAPSHSASNVPTNTGSNYHHHPNVKHTYSHKYAALAKRNVCATHAPVAGSFWSWTSIEDWVEQSAIPSAAEANERREILRKHREDVKQRKRINKAVVRSDKEWKAWLQVPEWKQKIVLALMSLYSSVSTSISEIA